MGASDYYQEDEDLKEILLGKRKDTTLEDIREDYRRTFDTDSGRRVLSHMLAELHFFDETTSEEEAFLRNYAIRVLYHLGVVTGENVPRIVSTLLKLTEQRR